MKRILYLVFFSVLGCAPEIAQAGQVPVSSHVVLVVLPGHSYSSVIANPSMPYLNSLISNYGLATNYYSNSHDAVANYFLLTAGTPAVPHNGTAPADNIVREILKAGKTWKAYIESLPVVGYTGASRYPYLSEHNPFAYFSDVANSSVQVRNLVPLSQLADDVQSGTLPDFAFVVPNVQNGGQTCQGSVHPCNDVTKLSTLDKWLKNTIGRLLACPAWAKDGLLAIVFDEGSSKDDRHGGGHTALVVAGQTVRSGYHSPTFFQHQSTLRMLSEALALPELPGRSAGAPDMSEFFAPTETTSTFSTACTACDPFAPKLATATSSGVSISSISPYSGLTSGGTVVAISGSGFSSPTSVTFGGTPATQVSVTSSSSLKATAPARSLAGNVDVAVTNSSNQSSTSPAVRQPVANPGFESGSTGWIFSGTGTAAVKIDSSAAHSGNDFVELSAAAGNHPRFTAADSTGNVYFPVTAGDFVTFGGWAYRVSGDGFARWVIELTDSNKANPSYVGAIPNATPASWVFQQISYLVPNGKAYFRFYCEIYRNTMSSVARFDDATLQIPGGFRYQYPVPPANANLNKNIRHIVYFVQENRSFDTYFGRFGVYRKSFGYSDPLDGIPLSVVLLDKQGNKISPFHERTVCTDSLNPGWDESHRDVDGGKMDKFMISSAFSTTNDPNGERAMGYYDWTELNYYYALMLQYATSDRFFSPVLTGTQPNRMYLYAGTSFGHVNKDLPPPGGWPNLTIFDRLTAAGVSWRYYYQVTTQIDFNGYAASWRSGKGHIFPIFQYYTDLQSDSTTPSVIFLERGSQDEHPGHDFQPGAALTQKYLTALMKSPAGPSSVFILAFDEGGGLYDHVPPVSMPLPDGIAPMIKTTDVQAKFDQSGFRIPFFIVSPWVKPHFISHVNRDLTSILKLVETRFGLVPLSGRDAGADDMTEFFDFTSPPRTNIPSLPTQTTKGICQYSLETAP